jgi:hypothetical protein
MSTCCYSTLQHKATSTESLTLYTIGALVPFTNATMHSKTAVTAAQMKLDSLVNRILVQSCILTRRYRLYHAKIAVR